MEPNKEIDLVLDTTGEGSAPPVISIVTLCYNTGRYICEGMGALVEQMTEEVEHVILDDASKDDSVKVMAAHALNIGHSVRIYQNRKNLGITRSKSNVISLTKGQFISGCADDLYLSNRVAHDLEIIKSLPDNIAGFYSVAQPFSIGRDGKTRLHSSFLGNSIVAEGLKLIPSSRLRELLISGNFIPAPTMTVRKTIYDAFPQDPSYFMEDYPTWAKVANAGWDVLFSPELTTRYRRMPHSVQKTHAGRILFDELRVKIQLLDVRLSKADKAFKRRWFQFVCAADFEDLTRMNALVRQSGQRPGVLMWLSLRGLPERYRWIFSSISLKFGFWKSI